MFLRETGDEKGNHIFSQYLEANSPYALGRCTISGAISCAIN